MKTSIATYRNRTPRSYLWVSVVQSSGQPGSGSVIRIRGTSSINGSDPLYVVDGVIIGGGIDFLNPGDIETIEVLKDAASAAIYGARGANGVIIVTTKNGSKARGMEVKVSSYTGVQNPWKKIPVLNATEYATLMNEMSAAAGQPKIYDNPAQYGEVQIGKAMYSIRMQLCRAVM